MAKCGVNPPPNYQATDTSTAEWPPLNWEPEEHLTGSNSCSSGYSVDSEQQAMKRHPTRTLSGV